MVASVPDITTSYNSVQDKQEGGVGEGSYIRKQNVSQSPIRFLPYILLAKLESHGYPLLQGTLGA